MPCRTRAPSKRVFVVIPVDPLLPSLFRIVTGLEDVKFNVRLRVEFMPKGSQPSTCVASYFSKSSHIMITRMYFDATRLLVLPSLRNAAENALCWPISSRVEMRLWQIGRPSWLLQSSIYAHKAFRIVVSNRTAFLSLLT